jgi:prevent-host-death family protein
MPRKTVGAARFKAECLRLIEQMNHDRQPLTITKRGRPVAVLSPIKPGKQPSLFGALAAPTYRFDDPFSPACDPSEWEANG